MAVEITYATGKRTTGMNGSQEDGTEIEFVDKAPGTTCRRIRDCCVPEASR